MTSDNKWIDPLYLDDLLSEEEKSIRKTTHDYCNKTLLPNVIIDNQKHYFDKGYVLIKNFFDKKDCLKAVKWLNSKNHNKLAKTWTEQEPGVPMAVYFAVHKGNSPISKLAKNKTMLDFASKLVKDKAYIYSSKVNLKAAWCGAVEYYHQDLVYWRDRGYPREDMISYMIMLDPHKTHNAPLHVFHILITYFCFLF